MGGGGVADGLHTVSGDNVTAEASQARTYLVKHRPEVNVLLMIHGKHASFYNLQLRLNITCSADFFP